MPSSPTYSDGTLSYGSSQLTITPKSGESTFIVIADSEFNFDEGSKRVLQTNQWGEPIKKLHIPDLREGSCTVQLPTGRRVRRGDTFVAVDIDSTDPTGAEPADTARVFVVEKAGHLYGKEDYWKQALTFSERLNTP